MNRKFYTWISPYEHADSYKEIRDDYLKKIILDYPKEKYTQFSLSFVIPKNTDKAPLLYAILESIKTAKVEKNSVLIEITNEKEFLSSFRFVCDLFNIIRYWKNTTINYNYISIDPCTGFDYLQDHIKEKYVHFLQELYVPIIYLPEKKRKRKKIEITKVTISGYDLQSALYTVIDKYIELYGINKNINVLSVSDDDKVLLIENSHVVDFRIVPYLWTQAKESSIWDLASIYIQELTHNDLFKFNYTDFMRHFLCNKIGVYYYFFYGLHFHSKDIDNFDTVDNALPELQLRKRIENYPGETFHFVLMRMMDCEGKIFYGIGNTKTPIHSFILKLCNELEKKDSWALLHNGASCLPFSENRGFCSAFLSWKGTRKRWRLENHFSYFYEDVSIKDEREIRNTYDYILKSAQTGKYDSVEFGFYSKPLNRWKNEELVYKITKRLYADYQVIYQYKPFFLMTENGNMSYDIYICGLKTAIEYQGKQHFEPIEYFGGTESFQQQQKRDKLKAELSKENGVKLVYINYWESITPDLVRQRVENDS